MGLSRLAVMYRPASPGSVVDKRMTQAHGLSRSLAVRQAFSWEILVVNRTFP